jgi:cell division protein FtsZ
MQLNASSIPITAPLGERPLRIKIFGVGRAGVKVLEMLNTPEFAAAGRIAVATDAVALAATTAPAKVFLENRALRGLGTGGDPDRGRALAEEQVDQLRPLCQDAEVIFILTGLGGGAGTGISPVLARVAREAGALVLAFVITPFKCEGTRRAQVAAEGLHHLQTGADGLVCLPNERLSRLITPETSVLDAFAKGNVLLTDAIRGVWRLLTRKGLIDIRFADLAAVLRNRHSHCAFAVAEASGSDRAEAVLAKLLEHPMLDGGEILSQSATILVSLTAGPDLTMAELNTVTTQITQRCPSAQVIVGAAVSPDFGDCLGVTVIASCPSGEEFVENAPQLELRSSHRASAPGDEVSDPLSRAVAPLNTTRVDLEPVSPRGGSSRRKTDAQFRQGQLPLQMVSKGGFEKCEPTIHKGEDLDVPTYVRRGLGLN